MDLLSAVALSFISRLIWVRVQRLRVKDESPPRLLVTLDEASDVESVLEALRLEPADGAAGLRGRAQCALERAEAVGVQPVPWFADAYPRLLVETANPPLVLWTRGEVTALAGPAVAVVGSRAASPYALQVADRLATNLAAAGVVVVSGLARGVDAAAHRGALKAGRTIAVLGSGPDVIYPPEHDALADQIAASGAVISELWPGARPLPAHFPLRNRIISGLALATVVVEASERSGSLITARCGLEQGRDVMAVPGNVLSGRSRGCHALLKDGAKVVESAADILEELRLAPGAPAAGSHTPQPDGVLAPMSPGEGYDLDELVALTGLDASDILRRLLELELHGQVRRAGGGRFVKTSTLGGRR